MASIDIQVPDIGDFDEVTVIELMVAVGDTIRAETRVLELRESKSRPTQGIVTFEHIGVNQRDEIVCRTVRNALMQTSDAAAGKASMCWDSKDCIKRIKTGAPSIPISSSAPLA